MKLVVPTKEKEKFLEVDLTIPQEYNRWKNRIINLSNTVKTNRDYLVNTNEKEKLKLLYNELVFTKHPGPGQGVLVKTKNNTTFGPHFFNLKKLV